VQESSEHVSILFADICDSMPLYEKSGDASAVSVIARCLDALAELATQQGGTVIRSKGDDLLCIFQVPARALDAAAAMVDLHHSGSPQIHVGIHFGPAIRARQDIYGDAVNVAARMLSIAKPGEIVASKDLVDALPDEERHRLALLGKQALKGKQEPIEVYSMVLDEGDNTQMAWSHGGQADAASPETFAQSLALELEYQGCIVTVHDGERCMIGRADRCDLVVPAPSVSREHASIHVRAGRVTLTDQSSTGTWVLDGDGGYTTLRRETSTLGGTGRIRLGRHPRDPHPAEEIDFRLQVIA
jgi:class 3 adenylate cyclase